MANLIKALRQTNAVREGSDKSQVAVSLTPAAKKLWLELRKNIQAKIPEDQLKITRSLFFETMIYLCKGMLQLEDEEK